MSDAGDRGVVQRQYVDATRLNVRAALHARYSTNRTGWFAWVWEQLALRPDMRVLEVGCGDGAVWQGRADSLPNACRLTLTDLSAGMLEQARKRLSVGMVAYAQADVQQLSFADASFDLVIANHVLYHVSDLPGALAEIRRVLADGGRLCATSIGERHMIQLLDWLRQAAPDADLWGAQIRDAFSLQTGASQLAGLFADVACTCYPDSLLVTEIEPLMDYALSIDVDGKLVAHSAELRALLEREMDVRGVIQITKESGMLTACAI